MPSFPTWRAIITSSCYGGGAGPRYMSQSTSIPKRLQRVRDHGFDDYMEVQKKVRRALKLRELILANPTASLPVSRLDTLARRHHGFSAHEAGSFFLRHPHVFHVFEHPVQRILWARLTPRAASQLRLESESLVSMLPSSILRLRKLLLLSPRRRLRLAHIRLLRHDLALPDDFDHSVIPSHPHLFRLIESDEHDSRSTYLESLPQPDDPELAIAAVELVREREYRSRGGDAEDLRFSFPINFPPGFKIGKYFRIAMWKWQRLPYWSPYEDVSGYDLRSLEAQRRMEKRAVAMIHELLSLTVERRTTLERIAQFRQALGLPKKLKEFLLQHQGVFYISTRGNQGKLHTVFLREAYRKGELVEPNEVYVARRKLDELLLMSPKKANLERMLTSMGRGNGFGGGCGGGVRRELLEYANVNGGEEEGGDSGADSGVESEYVE